MNKIFKSILFLLIIQLTFNLIFTILGFSHPYNIFLFNPDDRFADILKTSDSFGIADTWFGDNSSYRPLLNALPLLTLFIEISFGYVIKYTHVNVIILLLAIYSIIIFSLYKTIFSKIGNKDKKSLFLICVINYGFLFCLDRGNCSILTVLFLILFFTKFENPKLSMLYLACSVSLKITPIYFFIIVFLIKKDNLKIYLFYLIFYILLINLISYSLVSYFYRNQFHENYDLNTYLLGSKTYLKTYLFSGGGIAYGSSLITLISFLLLFLKEMFHLNNYINFPLTKLSFFFLVASHIYIYINKTFFLTNKFLLILFVCTSFLLFSPVTGDYYISCFVLPLLFFRESIHKKYMFPIILLLSPKNYIFYKIYSLQILFNPILMLWILYLIYLDVHRGNKIVNIKYFLNEEITC